MVSIIVPFKYDSENRLENILVLLDYVKRYWNFNQLILCEMDEKPKIFNLLPNWCEYVYSKETKDEIWSRSKRINMAMTLVKSSVTMILDSDVVVDWKVVDWLSNKIVNNEIDAATPFENLYHLSRQKLIKEMKEKNIDLNNYLINNKNEISRIFKTNGGCFLTKTSIFKQIRGMNELFIGWGLEDDELVDRYMKIGYRYVRVKGVAALHINHERTKNCIPDKNNFYGSITEKNRILSFDKNQILEYYGITESVGVYNSLDKPNQPDTENLKKLVEDEINLYNSNNISEEYKI